MRTTYAVVSGNFARGHTLYGPFDSVEQAQAWANHPHRAAETRDEFRVVPLFGGIGITDEPARPRRVVPCAYCGTLITADGRGSWVDATDGDGCDNPTNAHSPAVAS